MDFNCCPIPGESLFLLVGSKVQRSERNVEKSNQLSVMGPDYYSVPFFENAPPLIVMASFGFLLLALTCIVAVRATSDSLLLLYALIEACRRW